jgi:hypothetical protein
MNDLQSTLTIINYSCMDPCAATMETCGPIAACSLRPLLNSRQNTFTCHNSTSSIRIEDGSVIFRMWAFGF